MKSRFKLTQLMLASLSAIAISPTLTRMNPRWIRLSQQPLSGLRIIKCKALPETLAISAAAEHFDQVTREKEEQPYRPKQIVD